MKITVIGATGMIGSRVVAEATQRGHEVTAFSRSGADVSGAASSGAIDLADTAAVRAAADGADATVIAVSPDRTGGSHEPTLQAHRDLVADPPAGRLLIVGGAGSLVVDGVTLKDTPGFPEAYRPEAETFTTVLDLHRGSDGVDWTLLSPAPMIAPGERTGRYVTGSDSPAGSQISAEDFAVAVVDELENPAHRGARFTVANVWPRRSLPARPSTTPFLATTCRHDLRGHRHRCDRSPMVSAGPARGAGTDNGRQTMTTNSGVSELRSLIDTHLMAWVEPDTRIREELIGRCWTTDGALVDPPLEGYGTAGISELMAALQQHYPGHRFVRTSEVDHHHDTFRFSWELCDEGGAVALTGLDVGLLAPDGRLKRISGFFESLPAVDRGTEVAP